MKKKTKRTLIYSSLGIFLLILMVLIIIFVNTPQSFIIIDYRTGVIPPQVETASWQEQIFIFEAPIFGSATSSREFQICGDDGSGVTISSSYQITDKMLLSASTNGCAGNYIQAEGKLPAGQLKIIFIVPSGQPPLSGAVFGGDIEISVGSTSITNNAVWNEVDQRSARSRAGTYIYNYNLTELTPIKVYIDSQYTGVTATIEFNKYIPPIENVTIYRFENNKCTQLSINQDDKTANDYLTQAECESKIVGCSTTGCPDGFTCINDKCIENKPFNWIPIIAGSVILIFMVVVIIFIIRRKKKYA